MPNPEEPEISLRDQISEAFDEVHEVEIPPEKVETEVKEPSVARDEAGRFAPKEELSTEPEKVVDKVEQAPPSEQIKVPKYWKPEDQEKFKTLAPDVQKVILSREEETNRVITRQDEERALARQIKEVTAPYKSVIQARGMDEVQATKELFQLYHSLQTAHPAQKAAILYQIGEQTGADFVALANSRNTGTPLVDPHFAANQQRLQALEMQVSQREYQERQQQESAALSHIDAFRSDPAHSHFEEVKEDMAFLLQHGRAQDLKQAYEMAIWSRPDIRSTLTSSTQQVTDLQNKAKQKLRAAASVKGSPGGVSQAAAPKDRSLRDELSASFDSIVNGR